LKRKPPIRENPLLFNNGEIIKLYGESLKILILPFEVKEKEILSSIQDGLIETLPQARCSVSTDSLPIPKIAYNISRRQYLSSVFLRNISDYAATKGNREEFNKILGVTDVDLYAPGLNFIFGEAQFLGKAAVISLYRLRPEFYGDQPDWDLFVERAIKEAVHEIGHTIGLRHCPNPPCVMHFSLHIGITDRKHKEFCGKCRLKIEEMLNMSRDL